MGQPALTFVRQVVAACADPTLLDRGVYPEDVEQRARLILSETSGGSIGQYSMLDWNWFGKVYVTIKSDKQF